MNTTPSPSNNWVKSWIATAVILISVFVGGEMTLRSLGYFPNVIDNKSLWVNARKVASQKDAKVIALLGDSRMLYNIDTNTLREQYPGYQVAQLAICAKGPVAVLKDLAEDPDFKGIVICAVSCDRLRSQFWEDQQEYVQYFHRGGSVVDGTNLAIETFIQQQFAVMRSEQRVLGIGRSIVRGAKIGKPNTHTFADRSSGVDLNSYGEKDLMSMVKVRRMREDNSAPISPDDWLKEVMITEPLVQKIHARGGRVIFVRMPTSHEYLEVENRQYPKSQYWDKFEAATSAETIHFEDVAAMKTFRLPDRSHIDISDRARFTQVLTTEINSNSNNIASRPHRMVRRNKNSSSTHIQ